MTLTLAAQYLISSEVLATATLFGALALALSWALVAQRRSAVVRAVKLIVLAYVLMVVLISPFLYFFLFGHQYPPGATHFPSDLASLALPSGLMALAPHGSPLTGANTEGYLGIPLIAIIVIFAWQQRRRHVTWILLLVLLAAAICSFGDHLLIAHHRTGLPLPWLLLGKLPVLRYAIPVRLALFVTLPAALIVALFLASGSEDGAGRRGRWRWGLAVLTVAFILPAVGNAAWHTAIQDPAFFADGAYRQYLKPADHVLTIPAWGQNERWQADAGFRFKLADGYAGNPFPPSYTRFATWNTLLTGRLTPDYAAQLRRFVRAKGVSAIVVDETMRGPWRKLFGSLGVRSKSIGGVLLYHIGHPRGPA
jgi:hypothetical protein